MTRKTFLFPLILLVSVGASGGFRFFARPESPLPHAPFTDLLLHPSDPSKLFVASEKEIFLREGKGSWKPVLSFPAKASPFRKILSHPNLQEKIFLLTDEGILEADLGTRQTRWLFQERDRSKNRVYSLAIHSRTPHRFFLGTERGLFQSRDGGKTWLAPFRWPEEERIELVAFLPTESPTLLLATQEELFFSKDGGQFFESGFSLPRLSPEELQEESQTLEENLLPLRFTSSAFSLHNPAQLWIGTREGVFKSEDGGITWERLPEGGLEERGVQALAFSERFQKLFAATGRGVFQFHSEKSRWEKLPLGLVKPPASIALRPGSEKEGEILFVASGSEIFEWKLPLFEIPPPDPFLPSPERAELLRKLLSLEPSVGELQKRAIRYGNLGNGKIKRWHWGSRLRALIPRISFEKDLSLSTNVDIDRGDTKSPDQFILGPDERRKGWDLDLTWELGDFIWSPSQTSIDARMKSLVELRESILSQVTRIYFERRRVQMELAFASPEMTSFDYFDLLLRLDELTAQLDALTHGFLTRALKKIYQREPSLEQLWKMAKEEILWGGDSAKSNGKIQEELS